MIGNGPLARHALWNLLSLGAPMAVAVAAIPALIRTLGADRFAILALAWTLIGYCSLFDLGLGRALTKLVSEGTPEDLASTVWTALGLMLGFGCAGGLILAAGSGDLSHSLLQIPGGLQDEMTLALLLIAAAIPMVTLTAGVRGILEARGRWGSISVVRTCLGVLTFAGPLLAVRWVGGLWPAIATIAAARLAVLAAYSLLCVAAAPGLFADRKLRLRQGAPLLRFGGWLTVSNLLSPLMASMDRFLVGVFLPVSNVAYYTIPGEIAGKLQLFPAAVTGVLFPAFSSSLAHDPERARRLYRRGLAATLAIVAPIAAVLAVFAHPLLRFWVGAEAAGHGYRVMQLLAAGMVINAAAAIPASFLQARGRPDVNAKLHIVEFLLYVPLACGLIQRFGIEGAALAWVLRVMLDAALLFWLALPTPLAAARGSRLRHA